MYLEGVNIKNILMVIKPLIKYERNTNGVKMEYRHIEPESPNSPYTHNTIPFNTTHCSCHY